MFQKTEKSHSTEKPKERKGDIWVFFLPLQAKTKTFQKSHSAKDAKEGIPLGFFNVQLVAENQNNQRRVSQQPKNLNAEKNSKTSGNDKRW